MFYLQKNNKANRSSRAIIEIHNDDSELSQEQQERIFEPFYRTPSAEASFKEGWGLGLTISKACAERHGGCIRVESSEKRGVTFFVELPSQEFSSTLPCL
jgi:signal transduction histidine kinase